MSVTSLPDRPPLRLVDPQTGEMHDSCPECKPKDDLLNIKQGKLDAAWREIARLKKDFELEHLEHPERERVERLHAYWQQATGRLRSDLDFGRDSRFEAYLRGLRLAKKAARKLQLDLDPEALCRRAIDGAAFDPYTRQARNGHVERYDDPTTIFKNAAALERFVNRAPRAAA